MSMLYVVWGIHSEWFSSEIYTLIMHVDESWLNLSTISWNPYVPIVIQNVFDT